jgi:hypothetical protein
MLVPSVGSKVRVSINFRQGSVMIPPQPTTEVFEGTVLKSHKWLTDRDFCLTGDNDMPVRVISMSLVEDIELLNGTFNNVDTEIKVWQVSGSKGSTYTVTKNKSGYTCSCPGFTFRKSCKHISIGAEI